MIISNEPLAKYLCDLFRQPKINIVQIGAYVGDTPTDPLWKFLKMRSRFSGLNAVLCEPVLSSFHVLCQNCLGMEGVTCANVAITDHCGEADFYRLDGDPYANGWLQELGSLRWERMAVVAQQHKETPGFLDHYHQSYKVEKVPCLTFHRLADHYDMADNLDLLQIDAEGSDWDIIKTLDFTCCRPHAINYERGLLLPEDDAACKAFLDAAGYDITDHSRDLDSFALSRSCIKDGDDTECYQQGKDQKEAQNTKIDKRKEAKFSNSGNDKKGKVKSVTACRRERCNTKRPSPD